MRHERRRDRSQVRTSALDLEDRNPHRDVERLAERRRHDAGQWHVAGGQGELDLLDDVALKAQLEHQPRREAREEGADADRELVEPEAVPIWSEPGHGPSVRHAARHPGAALPVRADAPPRGSILVGQLRGTGRQLSGEEASMHVDHCNDQRRGIGVAHLSRTSDGRRDAGAERPPQRRPWP